MIGNLLTVSSLRPSSIWPLAKEERGQFTGNQWPPLLEFAIAHCFRGDANTDINAAQVSLYCKVSWRLVSFGFLTILSNLSAAFIPGGWIFSRAFGYFENKVSGCTSLEMARLVSAQTFLNKLRSVRISVGKDIS